MGFRSPSSSMAAILWYQDAARFLLMLSCRLTGFSSSTLGFSDPEPNQVLEDSGTTWVKCFPLPRRAL